MRGSEVGRRAAQRRAAMGGFREHIVHRKEVREAHREGEGHRGAEGSTKSGGGVRHRGGQRQVSKNKVTMKSISNMLAKKLEKKEV